MDLAEEKGVLVEGLEITFYMKGMKMMEYQCKDLEEVVALVRAWMKSERALM